MKNIFAGPSRTVCAVVNDERFIVFECVYRLFEIKNRHLIHVYNLCRYKPIRDSLDAVFIVSFRNGVKALCL